MIGGVNEEKPHPFKATIRFFLVAIGLTIIPELAYGVLTTQAPATASNLFVGDFNSIMAIGVLIAAILAFEAFFPKVTAYKMIFGVSGAVLSVYYFWSLLGQGIYNIQIGGAFLNLDITDLSILILIPLLLGCFIPISRFVSATKESAINNRRLYLEGSGPSEGNQEWGEAPSPSGNFEQFYDSPDPPPPDFDSLPRCL
jgi:hypothetical protein